MSIIITEQLTKRYGRRVGVDSLDLRVAEGELFGFLGPNGSGKTTTIRMLLGLLRPDAGRARILGLDCWRHGRRIKSQLGYLPGDLKLYPWMTARDALNIFGRVRCRNLVGDGQALIERFRLDMDVRARNMSKGMRQKLGLILALAHRPLVAILDEPTTALDPLMQDQLYQHLRDLAARGSTILFSSHTLAEVEELCDHVAILRDGRLVADERIETLRRQAGREVIVHWRRGLDVKPAPPHFLDVREQDDSAWKSTLRGSVPELLQWLARHPVEDVTIGQPSLESVFRSYYQDRLAGS